MDLATKGQIGMILHHLRLNGYNDGQQHYNAIAALDKWTAMNVIDSFVRGDIAIAMNQLEHLNVI